MRRSVLLRWLPGVALLAGLELLSRVLLPVAAKFGITYRPISSVRLFEEDRRAVERLLKGESTYLAHSPSLGWSIRPFGRSPEGLYQANSAGMRTDREFTPAPPPGRARISSYGDSFVHGDEVALEDTWQAELMRLDPRLEVLNFGVMGFGPDQAFLRYREESARFKSGIVLIGFMSENIQRVVSVFRAFYVPRSEMPLAKPRFVLEPAGLKLLENPLPTLERYRALLEDPALMLGRLSQNDGWFESMPREGAWDVFALVRLAKTFVFWYRRVLSPRAMLRPDGVYRRGSEGYELSRAILSGFYDEVKRRGEFPVIVLFPSPTDILRYRKSGKARYAPLAEDLRGMNLRVIDTMEALAQQGVEARGGVHYSPAQNRVVAAKVLQDLSQRWPDALR